MNKELEVLLNSCNDLGFAVLSFRMYDDVYDGPTAKVLYDNDEIANFYYNAEEGTWVEI